MILRDSLLAAFLPARFGNLGNEEIDGKMGQNPQVIGSPAPGSDLHDFHNITLSDRTNARWLWHVGCCLWLEDNFRVNP
jgi:hypothetical protein